MEKINRVTDAESTGKTKGLKMFLYFLAIFEKESFFQNYNKLFLDLDTTIF